MLDDSSGSVRAMDIYSIGSCCDGIIEFRTGQKVFGADRIITNDHTTFSDTDFWSGGEMNTVLETINFCFQEFMKFQHLFACLTFCYRKIEGIQWRTLYDSRRV